MHINDREAISGWTQGSLVDHVHKNRCVVVALFGRLHGGQFTCSLHIYICMYIYIDIDMDVKICIYTNVYMHMYMYKYVYICIYTCAHIHIYSCIHVYAYMYIYFHIYIHRLLFMGLLGIQAGICVLRALYLFLRCYMHSAMVPLQGLLGHRAKLISTIAKPFTLSNTESMA